MTDAELIEALTEQLAAARADAKGAEAYAKNLREERDTLRLVIEANIEKHRSRAEAAEAKLVAAVDWFETIRDRAKGDYMAHTYYLDALAALATIEGSNAP